MTASWLVARTVVNSHEDLPNAVAIQAETKLVPLNSWKKEGLNYQPPAPEKEVTTPIEYQGSGHPGGRRTAHLLDRARSGAEAVQAAGRRRSRSSKLLKSVGIGPGKSPANNAKLGAGTLAGLRAAVAAGPGRSRKN